MSFKEQPCIGLHNPYDFFIWSHPQWNINDVSQQGFSYLPTKAHERRKHKHTALLFNKHSCKHYYTYIVNRRGFISHTFVSLENESSRLYGKKPLSKQSPRDISEAAQRQSMHYQSVTKATERYPKRLELLNQSRILEEKLVTVMSL